MSSTTPPPLALPPTLSPDDLDALSELSIVLGKVRAGLQSSQGLATGTTPSGEPVVSGSGSGSSGVGVGGVGVGAGVGGVGVGVGVGGVVVGSSSSSSAGAQQHLSFKDVPGATDRLKHKLQHARAQVRALPDMDRTIDEQRAEIRELEARIAQQRALLERLRDGGLRFGKDASAADKMDL